MGRGIFITGTDTGIGKTWFTVSLMRQLKNKDYRVAGMKPIASGANLREGRLVNDDAELILAHCSQPTQYELVNPFVFEPPIAPHIAAKQSNSQIDIRKIKKAYNDLQKDNDIIIVEGVGGWRVPVTEKLFLKDLVEALDIPVLLVVGLRLGCINHALLTAEVLRSDGLILCAWAANKIDKAYPNTDETIQILADKINAPYAAEIPFLDDGFQNESAIKIDLSVICKSCDLNE